MRVEYRSTAEDYEHFLRANAPQQKLTWTTRAAYSIAIVLLIAFGYLVEDVALLVCVGGTLAVYMFIYLPRATKAQYEQKMTELARKARPYETGTPFSIELADHAMIANEDGTIIECPWRNIERIETVDDAVLIHHIPMGVTQIMRHGFRDAQHVEEFVERARALIARHAPTHPPLADYENTPRAD